MKHGFPVGIHSTCIIQTSSPKPKNYFVISHISRIHSTLGEVEKEYTFEIGFLVSPNMKSQSQFAHIYLKRKSKEDLRSKSQTHTDLR